MIVDAPKELAMKQARAHYTKKCREKDGKAYDHVPFRPYLPVFGHPLGFPLVASTEETSSACLEPSTNTRVEYEMVAPLHHHASVVKSETFEKLQLVLNGLSYGVTEKVNGERCLVVFDGRILSAYNRKGKRMSSPPAGALSLCKLGHPFVIDGERLTGDRAGHYVAFDLLEWGHEVYTVLESDSKCYQLIHSDGSRGGKSRSLPYTPTFPALAHTSIFTTFTTTAGATIPCPKESGNAFLKMLSEPLTSAWMRLPSFAR